MTIDRFLKDKRGSSFEGIALSVSIIAVAFVASADMLDYMTKPHDAKLEMVASRHATPAAIGDNLDYTPTASTGTVTKLISRSVIDPCNVPMK